MGALRPAAPGVQPHGGPSESSAPGGDRGTAEWGDILDELDDVAGGPATASVDAAVEALLASIPASDGKQRGKEPRGRKQQKGKREQHHAATAFSSRTPSVREQRSPTPPRGKNKYVASDADADILDALDLSLDDGTPPASGPAASSDDELELERDKGGEGLRSRPRTPSRTRDTHPASAAAIAAAVLLEDEVLRSHPASSSSDDGEGERDDDGGWGEAAAALE